LAWTPARSTIRAKPAVVNGDPRSLVNTNGDLKSCSLAQGPHFIADNGMGGRRALLGPADVQDSVGEIDLIPTQVDKLGRPQAVAEGDKDHGSIPVTPAIGLGGTDLPIDLGAGLILGEVHSPQAVVEFTLSMVERALSSSVGSSG